jgi:hypothetical protein
MRSTNTKPRAPSSEAYANSTSVFSAIYSGYRANERPIRFWLDPMLGEDGLTGVYEIDKVEDRWYEPDAEYFKVSTTGGKRYILRYDERADAWTLQSGFDGTDLLARPGIELITVEPTAIRKAESKIAGCERCRGDEADQPFDWILADVLGKHGAFDFILSEPGHCPSCKAELTEKTLVEPQGGIEIEVSFSL